MQERVQVPSPGNTWKIFLPRFLSEMQQAPPCSLHPTLMGFVALVLYLNFSSSSSSLYMRHLLLGSAAPCPLQMTPPSPTFLLVLPGTL